MKTLTKKIYRLEISSRKGHFNLCSTEESISCHIAIYKNDEKFLYTNLTIDYEYNPDIAYAEDAIEILEECFRKMFIDTSMEEKQKLLSFIKSHKKSLDDGSKKYRIRQLEKQIIEKQQEILKLKNL